MLRPMAPLSHLSATSTPRFSKNGVASNVYKSFGFGRKAHYESTVMMQWIIWAQGKKQAPEDLSEKSLCVCTLPASHG